MCRCILNIGPVAHGPIRDLLAQLHPLSLSLSHTHTHTHTPLDHGRCTLELRASTCCELVLCAALQTRVPDGRLLLLARAMLCSSPAASVCLPCTTSDVRVLSRPVWAQQSGSKDWGSKLHRCSSVRDSMQCCQALCQWLCMPRAAGGDLAMHLGRSRSVLVL